MSEPIIAIQPPRVDLSAMTDLYPLLVATAERRLRDLEVDRDLFHDGVVALHGTTLGEEDQMALDHYDRELSELRALIAAAKGEQ